MSTMGTRKKLPMPSSCNAREIMRCRSPAVKGFSQVWEYWALPMPMMMSVAFLGDGLDHLEMPLVEWLEPAYEQTVAGFLAFI